MEKAALFETKAKMKVFLNFSSLFQFKCKIHCAFQLDLITYYMGITFRFIKC